jgi:hypothetical protein
LADVAAGIRVLATRDGIALTEKQVTERARNIVAGLMGNYRILSFDSDDDDDEPDRIGRDAPSGGGDDRPSAASASVALSDPSSWAGS